MSAAAKSVVFGAKAYSDFLAKADTVHRAKATSGQAGKTVNPTALSADTNLTAVVQRSLSHSSSSTASAESRTPLSTVSFPMRDMSTIFIRQELEHIERVMQQPLLEQRMKAAGVEHAWQLVPENDRDLLYIAILYCKFKEANKNLFATSPKEFNKLATRYVEVLGCASYALKPKGPPVTVLINEQGEIKKIFITNPGLLPDGKTEAAYIQEMLTYREHPEFTPAGRFLELLDEQIATLPEDTDKMLLACLRGVQRNFLQETAELFAAGKSQAAFARWKLLPIATRNAIYGATYHHQKDVYRAAMHTEIDHPQFGEVAFNMSFQFSGYAMSDGARAEVMEAYLKMLG